VTFSSVTRHYVLTIKYSQMDLILSIFSGIDLLGMGFEKAGFCVVSAMDILYGHDIRAKKFPSGKFNGVIAGSPCQDFSRARRTPPTGYGLEMLKQFERVVNETMPDWFLLENVPSVPDINIKGYHILRFDLNARECGSSQNRHRHFQFGSIAGHVLDIKRQPKTKDFEPCLTASEGTKTDRRTWADFCELQGLPRNFDLPAFTQTEKYRAVGNGVNLSVAYTVAAAIRDAAQGLNTWTITNTNICACGCGRIVEGRQKAAGATCRKRLQIKRERALIE
jgi:DNA (cytosine-5)-methyltransferase 1